MAARQRRHTVTAMTHRFRTAELMRMAPHVYGAALAAASDESTAAGVTKRVLGRAAADSVIARDTLVERAILSAVRSSPAACFEAMPRPGREAVALARLAGYSAHQVASSLELGVDDVKASMLQALRGAALQPSG
jgi:DNA-directed RNA polymerase specialized sigma24 family protein